MKFDVELASPFHYASAYAIIASLLLAVCVGGLIWVFWRRKEKNETKLETKPAKMDLNLVKRQYLMRLNELVGRMSKMDSRECYKELSFLMRSFVFDATGVKVTKFVLHEINRNEFPELYDMIAEFYEPEFSQDERGDLTLAIDKVRRGIESWK